MRFRTLVLALALASGLTTVAEAAKKPVVHKVKTGNVKPTKTRKFKAAKYKAHKRVVAKRVVKK